MKHPKIILISSVILLVVATTSLCLVMDHLNNLAQETQLEPVITEKQITSMGLGLFQNTNLSRKTPLVWDECLADIAKYRSFEMVVDNYFAHEDLRTGEIEVFNRIDDKCFKYTYAGENLTKNLFNAEDAHKMLMESPLHKKNIMNKNFDKMGVGCYENICTELFSN